MELYKGSLMFNMNVPEGGQPSWGTELGQEEGYRFNFSKHEEFLSGMVFNSIKDIEHVYCPLGKGGSRQSDYDFVIASLFEKVFVNDTLIENGQFILLIIKQISSGAGEHIGRRSIKYNPRIKYNGKEINDDFFSKVKSQLGLTNEAAWFVSSLEILNQDELHLITHICDKKKSLEFDTPEDRKKYIEKVIEESNKSRIFSNFKAWLTTKNKPDFTGREKYESYPYCLIRLVRQMLSKGYISSGDLNKLDVAYYENIRDEYNKHPDIVNFDKKNNQSRAGIAALKKYIQYVQYLVQLKEHPLIGFNRIYYGAPGCGKSYHVEKDLLEAELKIRRDNVVRTTFYQDYSNTDFIGQILPKITADGDVTYKFNPGPFTIALRKALKYKNEPVALVIEEINRGSAASIFGEVFQLLDRKETGESVYDITSVNIQDYLEKEHGICLDSIRIPSNLFIVATMNTSDQNVFTLDTAFKRRWEFVKIKNAFKNNSYDLSLRKMFIPGLDGITWEDMVMAINEYIVANADQFMNEDKQIGVYFLDGKDLVEKKIDVTNESKIKDFSYKLLEYLWDDVAKFSEKNKWFKNAKTLDELLEAYIENGKLKKGEVVFSDDLNKAINENKNSRLAGSSDDDKSNNKN